IVAMKADSKGPIAAIGEEIDAWDLAKARRIDDRGALVEGNVVGAVAVLHRRDLVVLADEDREIVRRIFEEGVVETDFRGRIAPGRDVEFDIVAPARREPALNADEGAANCGAHIILVVGRAREVRAHPIDVVMEATVDLELAILFGCAWRSRPGGRDRR